MILKTMSKILYTVFNFQIILLIMGIQIIIIILVTKLKM